MFRFGGKKVEGKTTSRFIKYGVFGFLKDSQLFEPVEVGIPVIGGNLRDLAWSQ